MAIGAILGAILPSVGDVLDRLFPDKTEAAKAKHEITLAIMANEKEIQSAAASIVKAEAQSEHWITAAWRPILMLSITGILVNNYVLAPYLEALFGFAVTLDLPARMWDLLTLGVGGYVVGRSGEKIVKEWRSGA